MLHDVLKMSRLQIPSTLSCQCKYVPLYYVLFELDFSILSNFLIQYEELPLGHWMTLMCSFSLRALLVLNLVVPKNNRVLRLLFLDELPCFPSFRFSVSFQYFPPL